MDTHAHFIKKCSCGTVIAQCRCFSPAKTLITLTNGCHLCQHNERVLAAPIPCCESGCGQAARWTIITGLSVDDYTEACEEHVGALLDPEKENRVFQLKPTKEYLHG